MSKGFELNVSGLAELETRLKNLSKVAKEGVVEEIQASGETIAAKAKNRVPVDTGFLKNSISVAKIENGVEDVARSEYAAFVEFGTGAMVDVPGGLEDYAIQFKGKGEMQVNLPAQPFMFPSYFEEKPELIKRIVKKLDSQ